MFAEDLRVFFRDDGVSAVVNGAPAITVLFDDGYAEALGVVAGSNPTATCVAADVDANPRGQTCVIGGVTYKIVGVRPDGRGMLTLDLEEQ